jgi:hypothetical protein
MVALPAYAIIATSLTDLDLSQPSAVFDRVASMDRIARRRAEEERRDMLFVPERRRSRRLPKRDPRGASIASEAINTIDR